MREIPAGRCLLSVQGSGKLARLQPAVPNIYAVAPVVERLPFVPRLLAGGLGLACLAVLTLAASLPPNPAGVGTHQDALGLPACNFLRTTDLPCPACGMTTSFAWITKGNLLASLYVQPMGTLVAILAAGCVWGGLYVALTGRPAHRLLRMLPARYTLFPLLLLGVLAWGWKILIHLRGVDGWG